MLDCCTTTPCCGERTSMFCGCGDGSPDEREPILAGLLLKRARWQWIRRRAVLRRGRLQYGSERLDLAHARLVDVDEPGRHTFCIDDHVFRCDTAREKRRWLRDVAKASGIERPPPKPAPVVHGLLLKQGQHGLWNRRAAKLRGDPWRFEWCDPESQGRPGGRIDLTEATIVIDEDAFAVDGVRFKGLNAVDAARWLACIRAARSGASRKAVLELWSPTAEPPKSSPSVVLAVALVAVSCAVAWRPRVLVAAVVPFLRYVLLPIVLILVNAYVFRKTLVALATRRLPLRRPPTLDLALRASALRITITDVVYEDPALREDDSDDEEEMRDPLLSLDTIELSIVVRRVGKSRRLRCEISAEVTGLTLCYATYDARFRDTNLQRFRGPQEEDFAEEPPSDKPRSLIYRGVHFRDLRVRLVARSPFGARHLGTIQLRDETADLGTNFKSRFDTFAWVQGLAVRAVANVGFDVMDAAFSGAASAVTSIAFAPLDVADRVAERLGGSRVVTGVTGGVRSTVGGVVGGGTAVVGGSLAAGRALVAGATSGDLGEMGASLGEAGGAFASGVVGGVGSVMGGVAHAGSDVISSASAPGRARRLAKFSVCYFYT